MCGDGREIGKGDDTGQYMSVNVHDTGIKVLDENCNKRVYILKLDGVRPVNNGPSTN